jgi:hypothetical protein
MAGPDDPKPQCFAMDGDVAPSESGAVAAYRTWIAGSDDPTLQPLHCIDRRSPMNTRQYFILALLACMPLVACSNTSNPPAKTPASASQPAQEPSSTLGRVVEKEIRQARKKLATENISVSSVHFRSGDHGGVNISTDDEGQDSRPKAEITPKGDLLIDGKAVAINAQQRALLLEYRTHIIGIAESGMDIGVQGADLAAKAMGEAFKGIFSGKSEQDIEKSVEAEAAGIKKSAAKLCSRLPDMMNSQQKVAAAVPEFKPYATMTQRDIDDCFKDTKEDVASSRNPADEAAAAAEAPAKSN